MEDALSTVVLAVNIFTDQIEDEFCPITRPQVGTSLSGSTMSSTTQARSEKSTSQRSTYSEKTVQNQLKLNPHQGEEPVRDEILEETMSDHKDSRHPPAGRMAAFGNN